MMKMKKYLAAAALALALVSAPAAVFSSAVTVYAADEDVSARTQEVIVKKYRYYNGKLQYRHWNETRGEWVEDHWINVVD